MLWMLEGSIGLIIFRRARGSRLGYPWPFTPTLPLYARAVAPRIHAADSSRELVLWAPMPPSSWIRFPRFFSDAMPPRGPLELWLQHADCDAPVTGAEVEAVSTGKIFMTRGWDEVVRVCRAKGALAIHFEYDGASTLYFKVFDAEGHRLECYPGGERQDDARSARGYSSSSDPWESSGSPELYETPETSDDSYVSSSSHRARSRAAASSRRRR